jgi:pimeloyl-ACP methyl ester carboxylesterase
MRADSTNAGTVLGSVVLATTITLLAGYAMDKEVGKGLHVTSISDHARIDPDYRGAGNSWRPPDGYGKRTMAEDLHQLVREHLGIDTPVLLVGHDIGLMMPTSRGPLHSALAFRR